MTSDLRKALDRILEASRTKTNWNNQDRQFLKQFRECLGSPTEVAHALQVSTATIYALEKKTKGKDLLPPPPEKQLQKLSLLIAEKHVKSLLRTDTVNGQKTGLYDVLMRMRTVPEMMQRASVCDRFWVLRSGRPFVAANDAATFELFQNFIKDTKTTFFFAFPIPDSSQDPEDRMFRAMESFEVLQTKLNSESSSFADRIHGIRINTSIEANELGLVDPWISFAMAEYSLDGRTAYQNSVDVWMEFVFDISNDPQVERKQLVWLELPKEEAERWKEKRSKFWKRARQPK